MARALSDLILSPRGPHQGGAALTIFCVHLRPGPDEGLDQAQVPVVGGGGGRDVQRGAAHKVPGVQEPLALGTGKKSQCDLQRQT